MDPIPVHYLSPREVGDLLGISGDTIRRMIKAEQLRAIRMPPGNYYKIEPAEVLRYANQHQIPLSGANRALLEALRHEDNDVADRRSAI
jgi:excisionase family DNA binding protein